jgi:hypothetical protein
MPINIPTQKHTFNSIPFVFRHSFPMICGQVSIIRKSACANLRAPEIMAYSVRQQCCKSHCKNVPTELCNVPFTNSLRRYVLDRAMHLLQIQNNIPFVMQY